MFGKINKYDDIFKPLIVVLKMKNIGDLKQYINDEKADTEYNDDIPDKNNNNKNNDNNNNDDNSNNNDDNDDDVDDKKMNIDSVSDDINVDDPNYAPNISPNIPPNVSPNSSQIVSLNDGNKMDVDSTSNITNKSNKIKSKTSKNIKKGKGKKKSNNNIKKVNINKKKASKKNASKSKKKNSRNKSNNNKSNDASMPNWMRGEISSKADKIINKKLKNGEKVVIIDVYAEVDQKNTIKT